MTELDQTGVLDVEGYSFSRELWQEGNQFPLITPAASAQPGAHDLNPGPGSWSIWTKVPSLWSGALGSGGQPNPDEVDEHLRISPDLSALFEENWQWIKKAIEPIHCESKMRSCVQFQIDGCMSSRHLP